MHFDKELAQELINPWKLRLWMLTRLPMGLISGMVIEALDAERCVVVLKDHWWIRNPFRSVFWAVMGMAAELSTGALIHTYASGTGVQYILVGMKANFFKKARGKSFYFCEAGMEVRRSFEDPVNNGDPRIVLLPVLTKNQAGEILAEFIFYWQLRKPII
jgi:hypothetical protein